MGRVGLLLASAFSTGVLTIGACSADVASVDPPIDDPRPTTTVTDPGGEPQRVDVGLPLIPAVALPDISILGQTGDVVAERLGDLISPINGVDLVTANCAERG